MRAVGPGAGASVSADALPCGAPAADPRGAPPPLPRRPPPRRRAHGWHSAIMAVAIAAGHARTAPWRGGVLGRGVTLRGEGGLAGGHPSANTHRSPLCPGGEEEGAVLPAGASSLSRGAAALAAYSASKGALDTLTRNIAGAYASAGVRCNGVAPDQIVTEGEHAVMTGP